MIGIRRLLVLGITTAALALTGSRSSPILVAPRGDGGKLSPQAIYSPQSKEHYLSTEDFTYVRPGFNIKVNSITIGADGKPVVDLTFTDDLGQPLDRNGAVTPGALSASFIIAWYDPTLRQYTSYITRTETAAPPSPIVGTTATQATTDSGGSWTDLDIGHSTYTFGKALPANYDKTKTHTLGIYATRNTTAIVGKNYFANVEFDFRPDGQAVTAKWAELDAQSASCKTCHNPLSAHGGARQDVKLCVLCHSPQTTDADTGNTVDFKVMIHKIHYGSSLPSVKAGTPYQIIGFNQGVNDFSTVVLPQDIRNCATCHASGPADSAVWFTQPSRAACGSCHDDVDFSTGKNHPAGPFNDDKSCASCHAPQGDREYDASIKGAHTVPYKSAQLKGIKATILSVTNTAPGQKPTITFQLKQNDGTPINPASLAANLNVLMGGSTTDYGVDPFTFRQRADSAAFDGTTATYTFTNAIPANASGTWAFGLEARRSVTLNPAPIKGPPTVNEAAFNPVFYAAVTDSKPVVRRTAVDIANCNKCHDQLAPHGRSRQNTQLCVICHNPNESDRRPTSLFPPEAIDFKRMIHRIHTGENLTQDFTIIGTSGTPDNFNDVRFPGDRRDCQKCHVAGAYVVPENPPTNLLPTTALRDYFGTTPMQHFTTACLGCHDTRSDAAHAFVMTAPFGESCPACHGQDAEFAVDKVHAR